MKTLQRCACGSIVVLVLILQAGCFSAQASRRDLDMDAFMFHRDLRWQRCAQASKYLQAELRESFVTSCGDLEGTLDIQEVEILNIELAESNEEAVLNVRYTFVRSPSVTLEKVTVAERWVKEESSWRLAEGAWPMEAKGAESAPADAEAADQQAEP